MYACIFVYIFFVRKYFFCHNGVKKIEWKGVTFNTVCRQLSASKHPSVENG
jgi:hypothetical protein